MANLSPQLPLVVSNKLLAEFGITPLERLTIFFSSIVLVPNHSSITILMSLRDPGPVQTHSVPL